MTKEVDDAPCSTHARVGTFVAPFEWMIMLPPPIFGLDIPRVDKAPHLREKDELALFNMNYALQVAHSVILVANWQFLMNEEVY